MGVQSFIQSLDYILDPLFRPLLVFGPLWTIIIISILLSLLMTFIYKWTTNQTLMKELKEKMKGFQQQMKENRSEPDKMMALQKQAMEVNMKYMTQSLRPTLFTFLPVILIFGWLAANLAYQPVIPMTDIGITLEVQDGVTGEVEFLPVEGIQAQALTALISDNIASFTIRGDKGNYLLRFRVAEQLYTKKILITNEQRYEKPIEVINDDILKEIRIEQKALQFNFGFFNLRWLWTYLLISIVMSILLRKVLKIH